MFVLALDLEGTLVSNAMSQIPRAHLGSFFRFCISNFDHVVWFTAVRKTKALEVIGNLVDDEALPTEALSIEYTDWPVNPEYEGDSKSEGLIFQGCPFKDLKYVQEMFPNVPIGNIFIVDDDIQWISPEQRQQWVEIKPWETPYNDDNELLRVVSVLLEKRVFKERGLSLE